MPEGIHDRTEAIRRSLDVLIASGEGSPARAVAGQMVLKAFKDFVLEDPDRDFLLLLSIFIEFINKEDKITTKDKMEIVKYLDGVKSLINTSKVNH